MKNTLPVFLVFFLSFLNIFSFINPMVDKENVMFEDALSDRAVGYDIVVDVNVNSHIIKGKEKIFWFNNTKKPTDVLKFHLFTNGFSVVDTKLMKGAAKMGLFDHFEFSRETAGYTVVNSITANFSNLTGDFKVNGTVATLELPYKINPGESIVLEMEFVTKLPRIFIRSGYAGSYHMIAQWFPKLGVLNDLGEWDCEPYIVNGEFFADFGVYKCSFTFPENFTMVGTGIKVYETKKKGKKTVTFYAEDVHDVAFVLWDKFKIISKTVAGKDLLVYYPETHKKQAKRVLSSLEKAFKWYVENIRDYPYPNYKEIVVPFNALGSGGMEYQTLSTTIALTSLPDFIRVPEEVTIHEFGHSFFQGMAANNESYEGWLDEGLNTYMTAVLMEKFYGECAFIDSNLFCRGAFDSIQKSTHKALKFEFPGLKARDFVSSKGYSQSVYGKVGALLKTIENYAGRDTVLNAIARYVNEFSFKHPKGADFIQILNEETGNSFVELIDKVIYSECFPDASVISVKTYPKKSFQGYIPKDNKMMYLQEKKEDVKNIHEVIFGKREFPLSVNYKIVLSDGKELKGIMMGIETIKKVTVTTSKKVEVVEAWIDYDNKAFIDLDRTNNRYNKSMVDILKPISVTVFLILMEMISYVF